jgi:hypothetical protein
MVPAFWTLCAWLSWARLLFRLSLLNLRQQPEQLQKRIEYLRKEIQPYTYSILKFNSPLVSGKHGSSPIGFQELNDTVHLVIY